MVTMLLVALWLPASSHPLLEAAGLIHDHHDDHDGDSDASGSHEHHADDHEVADGNCLLTSTDVSVTVPTPVTPPLPIGLPDGEPAQGPCGVCDSPGHAPPGLAPPELSHRWQFSSRAALPVRAPSVAS